MARVNRTSPIAVAGEADIELTLSASAFQIGLPNSVGLRYFLKSHLLMSVSRKVFCGATSPRRPPGIMRQTDPVYGLWFQGEAYSVWGSQILSNPDPQSVKLRQNIVTLSWHETNIIIKEHWYTINYKYHHC